MKLRFAVILLLFISASVRTQTVVSKYAGEFLAIGVGGRALGMGGAQAAFVDDVTAGYWNPAGLARIDYPQISLMHEEHFGSLVNYNYASFAMPYGKDMSVGLSVIRLGIDGIPDTREALVDVRTGEVIYDINNPNSKIDPDKVKEFSNTDWAVFGSFAKRFSDNLYLGANVKIISRNIAEASALGIGFDIGAVYIPMENMYLGANLMDITTTFVAWDGGRNELISPTMKIGAAYLLEIWGGTIMPALDFDIRFEGRKFASNFNMGPVSFDVHTGLEYEYKKLFAVRAGFNDVKQFTIGAGIRLPKLNIDYSFARFAESSLERLPDSHRISLILTLEQPGMLRDTE
ncbi:MAG: PorV/PorQ family protein [Melioribacteraceae bacterium]|nr:PorV/PorQ family protein [Melioribacteraceae bacterium]